MTTWSRPPSGREPAFRTALAPLALALLIAQPSCKAEGEDARECNVNADCASGRCNLDGTCAPVVPDAGTDTADESDADTDSDLPDSTIDTEPDADPSACKPNNDGTITAAEMPLGPGFDAMFRVSRDIDPFNTAADCSSGTCVWDFVDVGGVTADEASATESIEGKWYADLEGFQNATYVSRMTDFRLGFGGIEICNHVQYGVFEVNEFGLYLLGIVSEFAADGTALIYEEPVAMLVFPMSVGTNWKVETTAHGSLCNSMFDYHIPQTYTSTVDAIGEVHTPYGTFQNVLRVNTLIERHMAVGVTATKMVTHTYVAECFTTVAAVASPEGESTPEFTAAAEVRRLTNLP